ncbi:class I SAM-dependent methyltransferase [Mycolicibacterium bacteremicum]|uniref:SAM-dependent methyltransferase n=1 Tax=Mycolicibacterium bacteremicum TaxID=564198 RepID=A0A1W9Z2W8_MYCBA|nr:class I SAM-dependent methyltransferase [Mycolicibacterium bacteremicum]MCV7432026.1 class I SAM-dependent methyltransferase [Mycolicibacterium bacteremicum]ORA06539.1 SAM-dependent methyltransferase [Mycolicibacterium bacteremicum]
MHGQLYDQALDGERCWIRHEDGQITRLPVHDWLVSEQDDRPFDRAIVDLCSGPTIDLGCGPGRLLVGLVQRGLPALGVDKSATAVELARSSGVPALCRDLFGPLPGTGRWQTALLADGNVGLGGDPWRVLRRAGELLCVGGECLAEFDMATTGVKSQWVRLESTLMIGPWFKWASVGLDCAARIADDVGLTLRAVHPIGDRVVVSLVR